MSAISVKTCIAGSPSGSGPSAPSATASSSSTSRCANAPEPSGERLAGHHRAPDLGRRRVERVIPPGAQVHEHGFAVEHLIEHVRTSWSEH